jgi:hypothetical protein
MKTMPSFLLRTTLIVTTLAFAIGCAKAPNDAQVTSGIQASLGADSGLQHKQLMGQAANGSWVRCISTTSCPSASSWSTSARTTRRIGR